MNLVIPLILTIFIILGRSKSYFITLFCIFVILTGGVFKVLIPFTQNIIFSIFEGIFLISIFLIEKKYLALNLINSYTKKIIYIDFKFKIKNYIYLLFLILFFLFSNKLIYLELDFLTQYLFAIYFGLFLFIKNRYIKLLILSLALLNFFTIYILPFDQIQDPNYNNFILKTIISTIRYGVIFFVIFILSLNFLFKKNKFIYFFNYFLKYTIIILIIIAFSLATKYSLSQEFAHAENVYKFFDNQILSVFLGKIFNRFDWMMSYYWKYENLDLINISIYQNYTIYNKITSSIIYLLNFFNLTDITNFEIGRDLKRDFFSEFGNFNIDFISWIFIKNTSYLFLIIDFVIYYLIFLLNSFIYLFLVTNNKFINAFTFINLLASITYFMSITFQVRNIEMMFVIAVFNLIVLIYKKYEKKKKNFSNIL